METLESLQKGLSIAKDLHQVVRTMKTLAAVAIRQYEEAVLSLQDYNRSVERGFAVLMQDGGITPTAPALGGRLAAIIIGSEQGLCGQFNEQIVSFALHTLTEWSRTHPLHPKVHLLMTVGKRVAPRLQEANETVHEAISGPNSSLDIGVTVQDVLLRLDDWRLNQQVDRIVLFFNKRTRGASYQPAFHRLLPRDVEWYQRLRSERWPSRCRPTHTLDRDRLYSLLIRQYLFVSLYRAVAESLSAENASRIIAMQAAEKSISERVDELTGDYHQLRQTSITSELLDVVGGAMCLDAKA